CRAGRAGPDRSRRALGRAVQRRQEAPEFIGPPLEQRQDPTREPLLESTDARLAQGDRAVAQTQPPSGGRTRCDSPAPRRPPPAAHTVAGRGARPPLPLAPAAPAAARPAPRTPPSPA